MGESGIADFVRGLYNIRDVRRLGNHGVHGMDFQIPDTDLRRLASDGGFVGPYPARVAEMYRQTLQIVAAADDESVLANFKCLRYRKFPRRGTRRLLALTKDADLVVRVINGKSKPEMIVERINCNGKQSK
jgi:hypothetical protein